MPNRVQTYVLHDTDPSGHGGAKRINLADAESWNQKGYGIFWTINEFYGPRRVENLVYLNAWAVDMDKGSKPEMLQRIERSPLVPTMVVETKSGYHVYWKAEDATRENWKAIVDNRLIPFFQSDKKAKDMCRILRRPGFYHLKNPSEPFLIKKVSYQHVQYSEQLMLKSYPDLETKKIQNKIHRQTKKLNPIKGDFWERVWNLDCEYALSKLSGCIHVAEEVYEFKQNSSGTKNIHVNGKSTSCWIDQDGRIGSFEQGGPTIAQWLNWFHKDYVKVIQIIKEVFPECQTQQMNLI